MTALLTTAEVSSWLPFDVRTVAPTVCVALKETSTERYESWTFIDGSTSLVMLKGDARFVLSGSRSCEWDRATPYSWIEPESREERESNARAVAALAHLRWADPWTDARAASRYEMRNSARD